MGLNHRFVFMGSPDFAVPVLTALSEHYAVVGVVTQPDRPAGRGRIMSPPPVKVCADQLGIESIQPVRLKEQEAQEILKAWAPDLIVVAAFGQILRQNVLDLPSLGCINVHASLLPRWRGAAPIQAAIWHGDVETGVTIMKMDAGIDTGAILTQKEEPIYDDDTSSDLSLRLAQSGAELLLQTLPVYISGEIQPLHQNNDLATYARMLKKEDGELTFNEDATTIERKIRAFQPWPGTFFVHNGETLKVLRAVVNINGKLSPGQRGIIAGFPAVGTINGDLVLQLVQPAGKKPMAGDVFLNGARGWLN